MKTILTTILSATLLASCAGTGSTTTAATKPYTKEVCAVSGNKLGSMGRPITKVYNGQEVKFCCKPCETKFEKNPSRYLAKLN